MDKRASLLGGRTWDGGGVLANYEHESNGGVLASQRSFTSTVYAPYSLLPSTNRNSYFLSARQSLVPSVTASFEGFYTSREAQYFSSYAPGDAAVYNVPSAVKSYGGTAALRAALPSDWVASLEWTFGHQRTREPAYQSNVPGPGSTYLYGVDDAGDMHTLEIVADGPLFEAPGGLARLAMGGGHRRDTFVEELMIPGTPLSLDGGKRSVTYAFAELAAPLVAARGEGRAGRVDFNVSGRAEHYSDFGGAAVPKLGLRYYLTSTFTVRGDWGKSFHAPTLYQVYESPSVELETVADPSSASGVSTALFRDGGNPGLRPERAATWTVGADYAPEWLPESQLVATYFNIAYRDRIFQLTDAIYSLGNPLDAPFLTRSPAPALQQEIIDEQGGNLINYTGEPYDPATVAAIIDYRHINIARQNVEGLDLSTRRKIPSVFVRHP